MFSRFFANKEQLKSRFISTWQAGNLAKAIKIGNKLVAKDPLDYQNSHDLGMAYFQAGDFSHALEWLNQANKLKETAVHWTNIGRVHQEIKEFKLARKAYLKARNLDPEDPKPWYNLSVCFRDQNDMQSAFEELKKIVEVHPQHLNTRNDLALHMEEQGKIEQAIEQFEAALVIDSDYYPARENMIRTLCDQSQSGNQDFTEHVTRLLDYYKNKGMPVEIKNSGNRISRILINGAQFYSI